MNEVYSKVLEEAMKHVDIDALAKKIAPKLQAEIEKQVIISLREDTDWGEIVSCILFDRHVVAALKARVAAAFK